MLVAFVRNNNNNKNKSLTKKNYLYSYKLLGNALWGLFWYILAQNKDDLTEYEDDQKQRRPKTKMTKNEEDQKTKTTTP